MCVFIESGPTSSSHLGPEKPIHPGSKSPRLQSSKQLHFGPLKIIKHLKRVVKIRKILDENCMKLKKNYLAFHRFRFFLANRESITIYHARGRDMFHGPEEGFGELSGLKPMFNRSNDKNDQILAGF